jgi:hypothetical protein
MARLLTLLAKLTVPNKATRASNHSRSRGQELKTEKYSTQRRKGAKAQRRKGAKESLEKRGSASRLCAFA